MTKKNDDIDLMINGIDSHYKQSCSYKFYKTKNKKKQRD